MGVLPYQKIKDLIDEDGLIENADIVNCIGPSSYELRIGTALSLSENKTYEIEEGMEFALKPLSHLLIGTFETIKMPNNLCATMFLKSKFGRGGFIPWGQGLVDPGYHGKLTISVINMSPHPHIFAGGEKLCHIIFQELAASTQKPYDGFYNGAVSAQGPREKPMLVLGTSIRDVVAAGVQGLVGGVAQGFVST